MVFCNWNYIQFHKLSTDGHNPYFNRWFSAIVVEFAKSIGFELVTILILIDGFLQFNEYEYEYCTNKSQSLF